MDKKLFYQSAILSVGIYIAFMLILMITFLQSIKKVKSYSFRQETFFEISLTDAFEDSAPTNKKNKNISKKEDKILKETGSLTNKQGADFESLFKNIKDKKSAKKLEEFELETSKKSSVSRKYGQENAKSSSKINQISKQLDQIKASAIPSNNNEYNKYYSKISRLLTIKFNEQINIRGAFEASVVFNINPIGGFSYKIERLSSNDFFNKKLREFLMSLQTQRFPIYPKGRTVIKVIFKTQD